MTALRSRALVSVVGGVAAATVLVAVPAGPAGAAEAPGTPWTFGANDLGQLGDGSPSSTVRPTPGPVALTDIVAIAGGREHVLALRSNGTVVAWGDNPRGQVGDGTTTRRPTPVPVSGLSGAVDVATGHYHSLALLGDGRVFGWGLNSLGQLGTGGTGNRTTPAQFGSIGDAEQAVGGRDMSFVRRAGGTVWCSGSNAAGECGDGTTTRRTSPVRVGSLSGIVDVAGGRNHGVALAGDGTVWTWGLNSSGQLGDGTRTTRLQPVHVPGLTGVVDVAAGADHSVAVTGAGRVYTWGEGSRGQLGLGSTADRLSPTLVSGVTDAAEVDCGRDQTLVVTEAGGLVAWGFNDFGQAGAAPPGNVLSPRAVPGLTGVVDAGGGRAYSVVLRTDGTPDTQPPTAPGTPQVSSSEAGTVDLSWSAATDDQAVTLRYTVHREASGSTASVGTVTSASTGVVAFRDTSPPAGTAVRYRVTASDGVNTGPTSGWSAWITPEAATALLADGFDSFPSGWTAVTRVTSDAQQGDSSPPSARVSVSGTTASAWRSLPASEDAVCAVASVRLGSLGSTSGLVRLRTSSGVSVARLTVTATGGLRVRSDVSGVTRSASVTVPFGSWHEVGLCVDVPGGRLSMVYDGATRGTWSTSLGTTGVSRVQIGPTVAATATYHLDDLVVTRS